MQQVQPSATPPPRPAYLATLDPLRRYVGFRLFWTSNLFFFISAGVQALVMGWLVYDLTHSTYLLGIYTAANLLPQLLGPLGGIAAERLDRVRLLLFTTSLSILTSLGIAGLSLTGSLEYWHLVVAGFVLGVTTATVLPALTTLVMDLVAPRELSVALALNNIAMMSSQAVGPIIGGLLLRHMSVGAPLAFAAGCSVVAILFLMKMERTGPSSVSEVSPLRGMLEGFQVVLQDRTMMMVLLVTFLANVFGWPAFMTFMPVFAKDVLAIGPDGLGMLQTLFGLGALLGAAAIAAIGDFHWKGKLYLWSTAAFGLFYALFALSHSYPLSLLLLFAAGCAGSAFGVMQQALLLLLAPPAVRGRVMGVMMLAIGVMPLSSFVLGAVASRVGVQFTAAFCGLAVVACAGAVFALSPSLRRLK